ncbi:MAG: 2OG-Fe(II) oxygenase [Hyphomicrobiaceae bacterium]|nr:2OG-Fe(II) oxygenase [Hyphomicrobiaceae bacterium]
MSGAGETGERTGGRGWLSPGEYAPWFVGRTTANPRYSFSTVAGRHVVLTFFGSAGDPLSAAVLSGILDKRAMMDGLNLCFFGVSSDPLDETIPRVRDTGPGVRYLWDLDRSIAALYGVTGDGSYSPISYVLDLSLRVIAAIPFGRSAQGHVEALLAVLQRLPAPVLPYLVAEPAPVLIAPLVFEAGLCRDLIAYYRRTGGEASGFMREVDGQTVGAMDAAHKRRRDCTITDPDLVQACLVRIRDRLVPQLHRFFQFQATRIERYLVSCYDEQDQGHFRAHRDNTTRGTAHRRFAVSLFLNSGDYEGGLLRFPEFGSGLYSAPAGGAIVFSCSMLHEATPVTRGQRYMFLPFLYDEAARQIRQANAQFLATPEKPARPAPEGGVPPTSSREDPAA